MTDLPKIYYCKKCDRFTDVNYVADKQSGRPKSYCYKCGDEMLQPIRLEKDLAEELMQMIDHERDNGNIVGGGFSPALLLSKIIKRIEKE